MATNKDPQVISDKLATQLQAGQFVAAAKLAKTAFKQFPAIGHFANVAGTALANADRGREALPYFAKALQLEPNHEEYQNNLVHAYIVVSDHDKVEALVKRLAPKRKDASKLYHLLAFSAKLRSNHEMVIEATTAGLETATVMKSTLLMLRAESNGKLGYLDLAEADYLQLLDIEPHNPEAVNELAQQYLGSFQSERALHLIRNALEHFPQDSALKSGHANALSALGNIEESDEIQRDILKLDPYNAGALSKLSQTAKGAQATDLISTATAAMSKHGKGTESWCRLAMTVGNLNYSAKNYKAAGSFLAKGNGGLARLFVHHQNIEAKAYSETLRKTPAGPAVLRPSSEGEPKVVLIIGQPRSGTTLTEMILSASPGVASCGELPAGAIAARQFLNKEEEFDAAKFEKTYRAYIPEHARSSSALVDKMPSNYRYTGLFLHGIAGVKIINIERDPRDVALSMWRQTFKADGMRFTNDLKHIAQQANLYRRYMNHWKAEFGDQFMTIHYDDLVADVEIVSKQMAVFCELEWSEAMVAPQKNKAQVRTASVSQVRQGVHKKSVGGWRAMEAHLQPLIKNLDRDLWPELDL